MKNLVYLVVFLGNAVMAQVGPKVEFENSNHDFGTIKEEDGPVSHEFIFMNTGEKPLIVTNVKPSCGCTTPSWTREPVPPGEKGIITAQYNPRNRPGSFRKSLTITTNAEESVVRLYINGSVIPKPKTIEEEFRVKIGGARFKSKTIQLGRMTTEKVVEKEVEIFNENAEPLTFNQEVVAPDFINIKFDPITLKPKSKGKMIISYNPQHDDNLGFNSHSIYVKTNEEADAQKELHIVASITEYFPKMSPAELAEVPTLNIEDRIFDFGKMVRDNFYETEFKLTNNGKSDLNIRKVKSNCACATAMLEKYDLEAGDSTSLKVKFNSKGRRGHQVQSITIYSNDPLDPTQTVTIKGSVANQ